MSSLIESLMECWMVDDTSLLDNNFIVPIMYMVLRLETPRMSYMSTSLFNIELICLKVSILA